VSNTSDLLNHERRITELEVANKVNLPEIIGRIQKLEATAEQDRVNKEQADRKEMAELRKKLEAAEAVAQSAGGK
jgi:hypothetical protein